MHLRDKLSLHEIAKRTGLSRNTLRNWLRAPEEVRKPTYSRKAVFGKLSEHVAELEQALKADALRPKKDRRTGPAHCLHKSRPAAMPVATPASPTTSAPGEPMQAKTSRHSCP